MKKDTSDLAVEKKSICTDNGIWMKRKKGEKCVIWVKGRDEEKKKEKKCLIESLLIFAFFRTLTNSIDHHEEEGACGRFENRRKRQILSHIHKYKDRRKVLFTLWFYSNKI